MAKAKRKGKSKRSTSTSRSRTRSRRAASSQDAIALLKADHRQVEEWFGQFEKTRSDDRKSDLAQRICAALKAHSTIEEEIFYPAFLEATGEKNIHHEAEVEHEGAKNLMVEIEASGPQDDYYDAKVTVLSHMVKHHVNEEEKRDGMFAKARQSRMDLDALGEQLAARKAEVMEGAEGAEEATGKSRRPSGSSRTESGVVARLARRMR